MIIEEKKYGVNEVFDLIGEEFLMRDSDGGQTKHNMVIDGFNVRPISLRYMTFYQKGTKCACCGKEGTHFRLCGDEGTSRRHFNLYADDGTLMTKDHIIPTCKGGANKVFNMQTMCTDCNSAKGSFHPDIKVEYIVGTKKDGKEIAFRTLEKAAFHFAQCFGGCTGKKKSKADAAKIGIDTTLKLITALKYGTPYGGYIWTKEMR